MLCVGDGVADDGLEEDLEYVTGFLVDEPRDTLDSSTTGQTTDGGLGDSLDVIAQDLAMALGSSLSKTFAKKKQQIEKKEILTTKVSHFVT